MMIKIITILIAISLLTGCSQVDLGKREIPKHLKLKAPKEKILEYREKTKYHREKVDLLGAVATSTVATPKDEYIIVEEKYIEYDYISEVVATKNIFFDGDRIYSSAEILPVRDDGKEPIMFYERNKWVKSDNKILKINQATTTLELYEEQTKLTLLDYIFPSALAIDTYNSSGTYTPPSSGTVEILVVAGGGGGGGAYYAGGGGAGGLVYHASKAVTAKEYTVTVGAGGAGTNTDNTAATNGVNSSFDDITAVGGGGGIGGQSTLDGGDGGSGGGGGRLLTAEATNIGGSGTQGNSGGGTGYGNNGGKGGYNGSGGGGGGAGAVGVNGSGDGGSGIGTGGVGRSYSISGSAVYYAGGGGGGAYASGGGAGGNGGGGNGGDYVTPLMATAGTANTGGGGGGCGHSVKGDSGKAGGSGIIIIVFTEVISRRIINIE